MGDNKKKQELSITGAFGFITHGTVSPGELNALEWLSLISLSLKACSCILRPMAEKRTGQGDVTTFKDLLNCPRKEGKYKEMRVTSEEVMRTLPQALFINESWLFIPVATLETREENGQFFERRLFILANSADLLIMDTVFVKTPHPNQQKVASKDLMINEDVISCSILAKEGAFALPKERFRETILPYLGDPKMALGENFFRHVLDYAVTELRERRNELEKIEREMEPFLKIRERLGHINCL